MEENRSFKCVIVPFKAVFLMEKEAGFVTPQSEIR